MAEVSSEQYQRRRADGNRLAGRVGRPEAVARRRSVVQILLSAADKERGIMASADVLTITDDNFQAEVLGSDTPVLVDFWAAWCGPCRAIAPAVEELARQYKGKLKVGKLDIDAHQNVPQKYGIMSIPTLILFKNGQVADQVVGAVPKAKLEAVVKKALPGT
jgi:thioredoxin 1